jgi:hypothetical protein
MKNQKTITMKERLPILAIGLLGVFATTTVILAPAIASAIEDFLNIREATVQVQDDDELDAEIETAGDIPTEGEEGAFGYGIITDKGLEAVIVTTTHAGVYDSEEQDDAGDPVFHNHYVALTDDKDKCGDDPKVEKITFESPGEVDIEKKKALLEDVPLKFKGTAVTPVTDEEDVEFGDDIKFKAGNDVDDVVSFKLEPKFDDDDIEAVCVTDIESADDIREK